MIHILNVLMGSFNVRISSVLKLSPLTEFSYYLIFYYWLERNWELMIMSLFVVHIYNEEFDMSIKIKNIL